MITILTSTMLVAILFEAKLFELDEKKFVKTVVEKASLCKFFKLFSTQSQYENSQKIVKLLEELDSKQLLSKRYAGSYFAVMPEVLGKAGKTEFDKLSPEEISLVETVAKEVYSNCGVRGVR